MTTHTTQTVVLSSSAFLLPASMPDSRPKDTVPIHPADLDPRIRKDRELS